MSGFVCKKTFDSMFAWFSSCCRRFVCGSLRAYQLFVSPMFFGSSCRYYPTCSQYALWLFSARFGLLFGFLNVLWRIVRCNPFCAGGIDYPIVCCSPKLCKPIMAYKPIAVHFWLVPRKNYKVLGIVFQSFYLIKSQYEGSLRV